MLLACSLVTNTIHAKCRALPRLGGGAQWRDPRDPDRRRSCLLQGAFQTTSRLPALSSSCPPVGAGRHPWCPFPWAAANGRLPAPAAGVALTASTPPGATACRKHLELTGTAARKAGPPCCGCGSLLRVAGQAAPLPPQAPSGERDGLVEETGAAQTRSGSSREHRPRPSFPTIVGQDINTLLRVGVTQTWSLTPRQRGERLIRSTQRHSRTAPTRLA